MEAPPHAVYANVDELLRQSNGFALDHGYKLVVVRSKTNAQGQKTWIQLACDRHGTKRNTHNLTDETRKKNRRSRRCECPMFCVASKTGGGLWELTVRNQDHNHGPYEASPKKKKDLPPQHSSELVNLPLLQTPSSCIADFCLVPVGTGNPSVSGEIAEVQRLLRRSGLHYSMSEGGTSIDGSWDDVMRIIGQAHSLLHGSGVVRIHTNIRVGSRTDKKQTPQDKITAVQNLLNEERNDARDMADTTMGNSTTDLHDPHSHHMTHSMPPAGSIPAIAPNLEQMVPPPPPPAPSMGRSIPSLGHHPMAPHHHLGSHMTQSMTMPP